MTQSRWFLLVVLLFPASAHALAPEDIFLVVNQNVAESREVALHYCARRGVPRAHILALSLPTGEEMTRKDYNERLAAPLRALLKFHGNKAKALLTVYGVPLRVLGPELTGDEKAELLRLQGLLERSTDPAEKEKLEAQKRAITQSESTAAVDSELMLLWWENYELRRWVVNPLYFRTPPSLRENKEPVLLVSRLDGPTPEIARRLVDLALAAEEKGLEGKVYVDARGFGWEPAREPSGSGYSGYDESLREMARLLQREAKMDVTLDDQQELFAPGSCPDCALYCGWYSLGKYVDAFRFVPGAVAYHIASSEAVTLRDRNSTLWCKSLLDRDVAATLGPVAEPYTVGFPKPAEFFGLLVTGKYPLVECYARTSLFTSWMTVLVGDPLYNPYARHPRLEPQQVRPSPAGTSPFQQKKR